METLDDSDDLQEKKKRFLMLNNQQARVVSLSFHIHADIFKFQLLKFYEL